MHFQVRCDFFNGQYLISHITWPVSKEFKVVQMILEGN
ncbi:hypothetical protein F6453_3912 [Marinobacter nauticus]|uniref:Uncharacterized protein n=1 Tax=Marinobacter nauticus TaxID=2743 RepID=A0A833N9H1_MARNT|nr:hypothetical protein F6453_3912 [Marinobacter nauticus]